MSQHNEQETPRSQSEGNEEGSKDGSRDKAKWKKERELLIASLTVPKRSRLNGENAVEDIDSLFFDASWNRSMKYFDNPKYRRQGLKWFQSTVETQLIFEAYKTSDHIRKLMIEVREGNGSPCSGTDYQNCPLAKLKQKLREPGAGESTLWAPRPSATNHNSETPRQEVEKRLSTIGDEAVNKALDEFVTSRLRKLYSKGSKGGVAGEQSSGNNVNRIFCDPEARWG